VLTIAQTHREILVAEAQAKAAGATRAVGEIDLKGVPMPIEAYTLV
jgi:class 3 adenylate cyclase